MKTEWTKVKWKEELDVNDLVKVSRSNHVAVICSKTKHNHCTTYKISPKDPNDLGGHWCFSHQFHKAEITHQF